MRHATGTDRATPSINPPRDYKQWHIDITFVAQPEPLYDSARGGCRCRPIDFPHFSEPRVVCRIAVAGDLP
jgi:hypothetical protein